MFRRLIVAVPLAALVTLGLSLLMQALVHAEFVADRKPIVIKMSKVHMISPIPDREIIICVFPVYAPAHIPKSEFEISVQELRKLVAP